jgi:tetratricopeptide (TPR) repeat protein
LTIWLSPTVTPPKVFISYAHRDHHWCDQLKDHLGGLHHQDRLALWTDHLIRAGDEWDAAIQRELDEAAIIIVIVSPAFLGSRFCQTVELRRALERHAEGTARVIPIIAEHCDWQSLRITELQARPHDDTRRIKPLKRWRDKNEPLAAIAKEIRELIEPREAAAVGVTSIGTRRTYLHHRRRTFFVGRDKEKRQLAGRLAGGGRAAICAVAGMGGVGKSELALQVAGDLGAAAFPDGIVTVDLQGSPDPTAAASAPLSLQAAMQGVLVQLNPTSKPPEDSTQVALVYRRTLVGKRLLLILDNARDEAQVTPLLPPEPVALLVTSRTHIALDDGVTIDLDTLDLDDAVALLKEEIGGTRPLDEATLARFAELCGYLPVALLAIAGTIKTSRTRTPVQLLARLEADRAKGLTAVLDRLRPSVEALALDDPDLARRFARLAVFAGNFPIEAAAFVWEVDEDTACDGLDELLNRSLLLPAATDSPAPRFRLHDLIREIATERQGSDADAAALRHATFYRDLLWRCHRLYVDGNDAMLEGLALFEREHAEILAGQRWAARHADSDHTATRLAADYPYVGGYIISLLLDNRIKLVWLEVALAACRRLGDKAREGSVLGNLGLAWAGLGETRKAIGFFEQQLPITQEINDPQGQSNALGNLGLAWAALGERGKAIGLYERQLAISRQIDDRRGEANALGNLGINWVVLGESRKGIEVQEQALAIYREIGDPRGVAQALGNLGLTWWLLGEPRRAVDFHDHRLAIARQIGDRLGEANALGNLGLVWAVLDEPLKAIEYYEQQLVIAREIGDLRGEGNALWNMASPHEELDDLQAALGKAKAAFVILRAIEDPIVPQAALWLRDRGVDPDSL